MKSRSKAPRTALYHRVSTTTDQDPKLAREELQAAAQARGLIVVLEVEEVGSGARNDRPGLQQIMAAARKGKIDAVIVWKLDRFGRSALDLLTNIRQLEDMGVRFIASSQGIDIRPDGDPMSRLLVTMLSAISEFERDLIIERTKLGLAKAQRNGVKLGRPRVAIDLDHALKLRDEGMSIETTAATLGCGVGTLHRALKRHEADSKPSNALRGSQRRTKAS